jgi:hypothetical protein
MLEYEVFLLEYRRSNCEVTESFLCEASITQACSNQDTFRKKLEWTIQIRAHLFVQLFYRNIVFDRDIWKEKGKDYPTVVATDRNFKQPWTTKFVF